MALTKAQLIDLNGDELILDLDADTSLHASTDDQIDIKIGGADDFKFTANTFTALAGSSIVVPDSGLTLGSTAVTSTAAELNLLDGVSGLVQADLTKLAALDATAAELNIVDGGTGASSVTIVDADQIILNDNGTMKQVAVSALNSYTSSSLAADDLSAGNAAVTLTTSSGNITIDTAAGDADIIFKGTDSSADITALTLDMSDAGTAVFNHDIKIADDGQIGSASAADAMIISSGGIVTFKDDILIKDGGTIGVASTVDAMTVSSAGIVTFVDDIIIKDGGTIGSASSTGAITVADITDGEITAEKLHTTLDFSTKTFTMHNNHVAQAMVTQHQTQLAIGADQIDSGSPTFGGNVTVTGNLTVNGTQTVLNTETLTVDDNIIVLNNNEVGTPSQNAGLEIERGTSTNVEIRWNETVDKWQFTNDGTNYIDLGSGYTNVDVDAHLNQSTANTGEYLSWNGTDYDWASVPSDIVTDTTPQLGGNLDVNGKDIVSSSDGHIEIKPNGSGDIHLVTSTGVLRINHPSGGTDVDLGSHNMFLNSDSTTTGTSVSIGMHPGTDESPSVSSYSFLRTTRTSRYQ